jgi:hypothetical protein
MLLRRLATSTSSRVIGSVTQSSTLTDSATASQSSPLGPPSAPSPGIGPWLALAPVGMIHNIFESLTGFVFLPLRPPVLSALSMLLRSHRRLLSGIIAWATFVALDCLLCFVEVF